MFPLIPPAAFTPTPERYARLGLRDNPFPAEGLITPGSGDPRRNGTIFAPTVRAETQAAIQQRILGVGHPPGRPRLAYLFSAGDHQVARGLGKSALLLHLQRAINADWGARVFGPGWPAVAFYVVPRLGERRLAHLTLAALQQLADPALLDPLRASLRWQLVAPLLGTPPPDPGCLLEHEWLAARGIDSVRIHQALVAQLQAAGVDLGIADMVAAGDLALHVTPEAQPRRYGLQLRTANVDLFTQGVRVLRAAGFQGAFLFIDDLDILLESQTRRMRVEFAQELGEWLLRGSSVAAVTGFFTVVLTIHAGAAMLLQEAWTLAGLQSAVPLSLDHRAAVLVPPLTLAEAQAVFAAYLAAYQLPDPPSPFHPFTGEAVAALLTALRLHPRAFLSQAHNLIESALADSGRTVLDLPFIVALVPEHPAHRYAPVPPPTWA